MSSINFIDLRINNAEQFLESLSEPASDNVYFTFGKVDSWANDAAPPTPNTQPVTITEIWKNMIGGKKITGNDARLVIRRNTWTVNTAYDQYDQTNPNLYLDNTFFYIITSDYNIYKCISNNNGANSTVEPSTINPNNITQTADGYIWKYMYTLNSSELLRFVTDDYIPIQTLLLDNNSQQWDVQEAAIDGAIYAIKITDGGSGYSNSSNMTISIAGDGMSASANLTINNVSNTVNSITMYNYGTGYTYADVEISGGAGSGATATALLSPQGGHGSDPVYELGAHRILLNPRLNSTEEGLLPTTNEFRQIAIIKNPKIYNDTNVSSNSVVSQTLDLTVFGSGVDYEQDENIYQGPSLAEATFSAKVHSYESANNLLRAINFSGTPTNDTLTGANSTAAKFVSSVTYPDLELYTGRILYVDNIEPIERADDQTEDFRILLTF